MVTTVFLGDSLPESFDTPQVYIPVAGGPES